MSDRTRVLRYKRSALASMGAQEIMLELESIVEACDGIRYYIEQADGDETLLNALDGDEDEAWEFRMAFADLSAQADQLQTTLYNQYFEDFYREFDDATVALIGNRLFLTHKLRRKSCADRSRETSLPANESGNALPYWMGIWRHAGILRSAAKI